MSECMTISTEDATYLVTELFQQGAVFSIVSGFVGALVMVLVLQFIFVVRNTRGPTPSVGANEVAPGGVADGPRHDKP